jgi:uncharacterized protein YneF (UPF0154 family)
VKTWLFWTVLVVALLVLAAIGLFIPKEKAWRYA